MGNVTRPKTVPKRSNRNVESNEAKLRELASIRANFIALAKTIANKHQSITKKIRAGTANADDLETIQNMPRMIRRFKQGMANIDKKVRVLIRRTLAHA
jgi:hypothetical protein